MLFYNGIGSCISFLFFLIREFKRFHCNSAHSSAVVARHIFMQINWHGHQNIDLKIVRAKFVKRP